MEEKIIFIKEENELSFVQNNLYSTTQNIEQRCEVGDIIERHIYDRNKLKGVEEVRIQSSGLNQFTGKELEQIRIYSVELFDDVSVKLVPKELHCDVVIIKE